MRTHPLAARAFVALACAALAPAPCGARRAKHGDTDAPASLVVEVDGKLIFSSEAAARVIKDVELRSGSVRFWHKEAALEDPSSPIIRLSTVPDTGTTWVMRLFEAATGIATQVPNNGADGQDGSGTVMKGTMTQCRVTCAWRPPWECAEEIGIRLAEGSEPELFKSHFPVTYEGPFAGMFDTRPPISKTVVLVRNPIDGFLATQRHASLDDGSKVGEATQGLSLMATQALSEPLQEFCNESGEAPLRMGTNGYGEDVLETDERHFLSVMTDIRDFGDYMAQWAFFVAFWFTHVAAEHTSITMARYEDLAMHTEAVLERFLNDAGFQLQSATALQDAMDKYPTNTTKLQRDTFFNPSLWQDSLIQEYARRVLNNHGALVDALGYEDWLSSMTL